MIFGLLAGLAFVLGIGGGAANISQTPSDQAPTAQVQQVTQR